MSLSFDILRPEDLLSVTVQAVNLKLDTSLPAQPRLVRQHPGQAAYLVFVFAPQAIAEQAYFETAAVPQPGFNPPPSNPPLPPPQSLPTDPDALSMPGGAAVRMAGSSRLVFRLPATLHAVAYSIAGLLDWSQLEPVLPLAATVMPGASGRPGEPAPPIAAPGPLETALELPYRLIISPNLMPGGAAPGWVHSSGPVRHAARAELWHTRLGRRTGSGGGATEASAAAPVPLRPVWSPDFEATGPLPDPPPDASPRWAMSARDRDQIVILSAGFSGYTLTDPDGTHQYVPAPLDADRLFLSALGGWLTSRGAWPYPVSYTYPVPGSQRLAGAVVHPEERPRAVADTLDRGTGPDRMGSHRHPGPRSLCTDRL